jgi:hypothetical protein
MIFDLIQEIIERFDERMKFYDRRRLEEKMADICSPSEVSSGGSKFSGLSGNMLVRLPNILVCRLSSFLGSQSHLVPIYAPHRIHSGIFVSKRASTARIPATHGETL